MTRDQAPLDSVALVRGILVLLACQLAGTLATEFLSLPIPGAVVGMVALFGILVWRRAVPHGLEATSFGLLRHLGLLFIPAGVGVIQHLDALDEHALALAITLVGSTLAALLVTGATLQYLLGAESDGEGDSRR